MLYKDPEKAKENNRKASEKYHHSLKGKETIRHYYETHKEQIKEKNRKRYQTFKEQLKKQHKGYYDTHKEQLKEEKKNWKKEHPDEWRERCEERNWLRRGLGKNRKNKWFEGSEAHHENFNDVWYIPKELHHSVYHDIWTGRGMAEVNAKAFEWLNNQRLADGSIQTNLPNIVNQMIN